VLHSSVDIRTSFFNGRQLLAGPRPIQAMWRLVIF